MKYLDLAIANETIQTTDIKGKEYAEVNQRIKAFRMVYPQGVIETEMLSNENGVCVFKAFVGYRDGDELYKLATGTAYEKEDSSFINKTSYIENCETSAVGRALGMAGFGIDVSVASAEEVQNAINNQVVTQEEADNYTLEFGKHKGKKLTEVPADYIEWLMGNTQDERMLKLIELATGMVMPSEEEQMETLTLMNKMNELVRETGTDIEKICEQYGVEDTKKLNIDQLKQVIRVLEKRQKEAE